MLSSQVGRQIGTIDHQVAEELAKRCLLSNLHRFHAHSRSFRKCVRIVRHNDAIMNYAF